MKPRLWSGVLSPFSAKVRIALAEKGVEYELLDRPWTRERKWEPKPADFLAVSPRGEVPVLLDGELAIHDSTVICEYLEERFPEPPLMPADPVGRARCRMLEDDADRVLASPITVLIEEVFLKPEEADRDAARVAEAVAGMNAYYQGLDEALSGDGFLLGAFSLADIAAFLAIGFGTTLGVAPDPGLASVQAWLGRARARQTLAGEFEAMMKAAAGT